MGREDGNLDQSGSGGPSDSGSSFKVEKTSSPDGLGEGYEKVKEVKDN